MGKPVSTLDRAEIFRDFLETGDHIKTATNTDWSVRTTSRHIPQFFKSVLETLNYIDEKTGLVNLQAFLGLNPDKIPITKIEKQIETVRFVMLQYDEATEKAASVKPNPTPTLFTNQGEPDESPAIELPKDPWAVEKEIAKTIGPLRVEENIMDMGIDPHVLKSLKLAARSIVHGRTAGLHVSFTFSTPHVPSEDPR
jgi:hypothetical protein